jgi:hypothetical protein
MPVTDVLADIATPEFDYNLLMSRLSGYRQPWAKIRYMLRHGELIRVRAAFARIKLS